ncbi:hypothetical protein Acid7E03_01540 [Acidisoma sp. 7E03]
MGAGGDAAEDRIGRVHLQALAGGAPRQKAARQTIGERRLADPLAAGDQPGMVQPAAGARLTPEPLGRLMAEQVRVFAR